MAEITRCPKCNRIIRKDASTCTYCGTQLIGPQQAYSAPQPASTLPGYSNAPATAPQAQQQAAPQQPVYPQVPQQPVQQPAPQAPRAPQPQAVDADIAAYQDSTAVRSKMPVIIAACIGGLLLVGAAVWFFLLSDKSGDTEDYIDEIAEAASDPNTIQGLLTSGTYQCYAYTGECGGEPFPMMLEVKDGRITAAEIKYYPSPNKLKADHDGDRITFTDDDFTLIIWLHEQNGCLYGTLRNHKEYYIPLCRLKVKLNDRPGNGLEEYNVVEYLRPGESGYPYWTVDIDGEHVRLRKAPSLNGEIFSNPDGTPIYPENGESLEFLKWEGDWCKVRYKGHVLYVYGQYIIEYGD